MSEDVREDNERYGEGSMNRPRPRFYVAFHISGGGLVIADARDLDLEIHDGDVVANNGDGEVFRAPVGSIVTIELRRESWLRRLFNRGAR